MLAHNSITTSSFSSKYKNYRSSATRIIRKLRHGLKTPEDSLSPARALRTQYSDAQYRSNFLTPSRPIDHDRPRVSTQADEVLSQKSFRTTKSMRSAVSKPGNNKQSRAFSSKQRTSVVHFNRQKNNAESRSSNRDKSAKSIIGQKRPTYQDMSLEEIEMTLDTLIQEKIRILMETNKQRLVLRPKSNFEVIKEKHIIAKINQELELLVGALKKKKSIDNNLQPQSSMSGATASGNILFEKWKALDSKIQLVEKILAENSTQLQIMKNYFAIFANRRTSYKLMSANPSGDLVGSSQKYKISMDKPLKLPLASGHRSLTEHNESKLPLHSTAKIQYKSPGKDDYQKFRYRHPAYQKLAEHVCNSVYKNSYPFFPGFQQVYFKGRLDSLARLHESRKDEDSSYRRAYIPVKTQVENYKELDCYKDKYRNLPVNCETSPLPPSNSIRGQLMLLEKQLSSRVRIKRDSVVSCSVDANVLKKSRCLESTNKSDYGSIDQRDQRMLANRPRHKRLETLKYNLKAKLH